MRVVVETKLTPAMTIYDSTVQATGKGGVMKFLDPVVAVTDDNGNVLYQSGEFYESLFPYVAAGAGIAAGIILYLIFREK
jgi:hypothetical protein